MPIVNGPVSPPPQRLTAGCTTDPPYWPLSQCGWGNPFFYHAFSDDFDNALSAAGLYTITATGGSVAHTAGDGGLALFTTGAVAGNFASIQLPVGDFTLPGTGNAPPGTSLSTKKLFYISRVQVSAATTDGFIIGLGGITATPFAAGVDAMTDGLYFYKAPGGTTVNLVNRASAGNSPTGGAVLNSFPITAFTTLGNNLSFDYAIFIDHYQNIRVWIADQLVGFLPQSGSGAVGVGGVTADPVLGPIFANYNFQAQFTSVVGSVVQNPLVFSTANMSPIIAVTNGATAAATTLTADFHGVFKER